MGVSGKLRVNRYEQGKKVGKALLAALHMVIDVKPRPVGNVEERVELLRGIVDGLDGWTKLALTTAEKRDVRALLRGFAEECRVADASEDRGIDEDELDASVARRGRRRPRQARQQIEKPKKHRRGDGVITTAGGNKRKRAPKAATR